MSEEFINPIDPDKITENPNTLSYPHHAGSAVVKPIDQGKMKGRAVSAMEHQTDMQLHQIYEQMQLLAAQANKLSERKKIAEFIYLAEMRFEPLINHTYYLYQRDNGGYVLSMVGPQQWGNSRALPTYMATIKLLADHTWDIVEKNESVSFGE